MNAEAKGWLRSFLLELMVYSVLVVIYYFCVLHFLGDWLIGLFSQQRKVYAFVALLLIVGQGILLETLTTALLKVIKPGTEKE
jgi:hypothetical protein